MTSDDQLVLFYRVLKSNNTFNSLAVVYDVGPRCVSHVFESVLEILFNHSDERLWWLDGHEYQAEGAEEANQEEGCEEERFKFEAL